MNLTAQQISLDNALVTPENRVNIGICNMRINPTKTPKEPTYHVFLDALALTTCYPTFLIISEVPEIYMHQFWHNITKIKNSSSYKFKMDKKKCSIEVEVFRDILQICPRLPNQEFVVPHFSNPKIVSFIKELRYTGDIDSITKVYTDHMHQPWRTFATVINRCLSGKTIGLDKIILSRAQIMWRMYYNQNVDFVKLLWEDFMFQIDNRDSKKQEKIILGSLRFVSKTKEYQVYGALITADMTNLKMQKSPAYKAYLAYATGGFPPNKSRKFKKPTSPSKKKNLVAVEKPAKKPAKKPDARRQSAGVQIRDTLAALLEEAQLKKAIKRSKLEIDIHQAGGSSEGAGLEPEVLDEQKGKSTDTNRDDDDDDQQGDDERTESDNDKDADLNKIDEEEEDEFVHTPDDYVCTNDENIDDEEYDRINKEMYSDVNVELKDTKLEGEGKDDKEITDAGHVDVEHENVNQEVAGDQVKDVDQAIVTAAPATQKTKVPLPSSSISSDYATNFLNFDNIPSVDNEIISMIDIKVQHENLSSQTSPLLIVPISTLRNVDHSSTIHATIKSEVPTIIKEYLGTSLDDALHKKRKPDDADKDEGPLAGSNQGLKRKKMSKDAEPLKKSKSTKTSKGTTKSQPKSTDMGNTDEPPVVNADPKDWFKKPERTPTPDPDAFAMNRLQISDLTQDILVGPAYKLLKGTCRSYVELDYNMKECYKALNDQLDWNNPEGDRYPFDLSKPLPLVQSRNHQIVSVDYFFNNDLAYLQGGSIGRTYTTSLTKTKAVKYDLQGIVDMAKQNFDVGMYVYGLNKAAPQDGVSRRAISKAVEADGVSEIVALTNQMAMFNKKFDKLNATVVRMLVGCESCGSPHLTRDCDDKPMSSSEDACWVNQRQGNFQSGGSSGNTSYKQGPLGFYQANHTLFQQPQQQHIEKKSNFKELMTQYITGQNSIMKDQQASIHELKTPSGSGKQTTDPPFPSNENVVNPVNQEENDKVKSQSSPSTTHVKTPLKSYEPKLPYPGRYKKEKEAEQYGKFLDLFKQLHINLPFVEALSQMPKYAKFLKDLLTNKKKLEDLSTVTMCEECSAILDGKLPKKMSDLGSFTIPCQIRNLSVYNALADLGASINLM
ncbi:hypothetical protein Tco_1314108 [Tanacetum coccineum]